MAVQVLPKGQRLLTLQPEILAFIFCAVIFKAVGLVEAYGIICLDLNSILLRRQYQIILLSGRCEGALLLREGLGRISHPFLFPLNGRSRCRAAVRIIRGAIVFYDVDGLLRYQVVECVLFIARQL